MFLTDQSNRIIVHFQSIVHFGGGGGCLRHCHYLRTEKASKMEDEAERKRYAEQVAIAFWNSIADDQDEVLFSSDEDPNHVYV